METKKFIQAYYKGLSPTKTSGIYAIYCSANDKIYIGQSLSISRRWVDHKALLRKKKSKNIHLQRCWDLYGPDFFLFFVVEHCDKDSLTEREGFYLSILNHDSILNLDSVSDSFQCTDEHRKRMSEAAKNRSPEAQSRISEAVSKAKRGKPAWNKGLTGIYSEETRSKISQSQIGRSSPRKGIKLTDEQKANISNKIKKKWEDPSYRKSITESVKRKSRHRDSETGKFTG